MAWIQAQASDYKDCLEQVKDFITKAKAAGAVTQNVGSFGQVYGASATAGSIDETWTIICTTLGGDETAKFSVTGSVSGGQAEATSGEPYSIDKISFIITAGTTDFAVDDEFEFAIAASTAEWSAERWDTDYDGSGGYELIAKGIGAGTDEIFIGINTKTDDSTYWNWLVTGLTGYQPHVVGKDKPMEVQPGHFPYYDCLNNANPFTFYCIFTSRHIKVVSIIGTVFGGLYIGWLLPHATPSQWTYPLFCGGSTDDVGQALGGTEDDHTLYWAAHSDEKSGAVLDMSVWNEINRFSPRHYGDFKNWRPTLDGKMVLYPAVPIHESSNNVYGTLEGVYYPTPYVPSTGLLTDMDVVVTADVTALTFRDITRPGAGT